MKVSRQLRAEFAKVDLGVIDEALGKYDVRHVQFAETPKTKPTRLLGWQGSLFLYSILAKSRALYFASILSWNMRNASSAFLNVRAHYEATAGLGHFMHHLHRFYAGEIDQKTLDGILYQKSFGVRDPRWKEGDFNPPDAINVLTQIAALDTVWVMMYPGCGDLIYKKMYDSMCEFCHLNFGGMDLHREILADGVEFDSSLVLREEAFGPAANALDLSLLAFFPLFDAALELLAKHEQMPLTRKLR